MLYNIAITSDDIEFKKYYNCIARAFYQKDDYNHDDYLKMLPCWNTIQIPKHEEDRIKAVHNSFDNIIKKVCVESDGLYFYRGDDSQRKPFPFVGNFHSYFLKNRKWNTPLRDPQNHAEELFRLHKEENGSKNDQNYSAKSGDHNHFVNVVAATARLINYFSESKNIRNTFSHTKHDGSESFKTYFESIYYNIANDGKRIFALMLASFLHDIGKTVVYHRHGMEGYIIISDHASQSWHQIKKIAELYNFDSEFSREDLLYVADLLDFHDQFGTLSTGEAGYQRIVDIVERLKRYSLTYTGRQGQILQNEKYLFDLWVLNVADIMVSIDYQYKNKSIGKFDKQEIWLDAGSSRERIIDFFNGSEKCKNLVHDLKIARSLLKETDKHRHSDICCGISERARSLSDRHVVERIRRLVFSSLRSVAKKEIGKIKEGKSDALLNIKDILQYFSEEHCLTESQLNLAIVRSIESIREFKDFCLRFSWIGQMDYCLGFFEKIIARAFNRINYELENIEVDSQSTPETMLHCSYRTKLIRDKLYPKLVGNKSLGDDTNKLQGKLFIENYISCVVMVLDLLLFKEESINRLKNIEFNETRERLNNEKIDTILAINGIYNSKRTLHLILKTVFIY